MRSLRMIAAFSMLFPMAGWSADDEGNFAVHGAGSQNCQRFMDTAQADDAAIIDQYLSWMQGYMTAIGRQQQDTFDVSPVLSPQEMGTLLLNICRRNPDERVESALASLIDFMSPVRVTSASGIVQVASGDNTLAIRESVLESVHDRLEELEYDTGERSALFNQQVQDSLRDFQRSNDLEATGLPNARTMLRLFFD